ncbi:MAG: hypothetical protein U0792_12260 [Gemmataceae bacterium]
MTTMALCLDEFLAAGGSDTPATKTGPPKNPKEIQRRRQPKITVGEPADGKRTVKVTLAVAEGWHIYANPVGGDDLLDSQTQLTVFVDGKEAMTEVVYPKGKSITDAAGAKYSVYGGPRHSLPRCPRARTR